MASIVLQLQEEAQDKDANVADVLRKALVVAQKLKISDSTSWIKNELNGYKSEKIPEYRKVSGNIKARDPYGRGWSPVRFQDPKIAEILSNRKMPNSIGELEHLVSSTDRLGSFTVDLPQDLHNWLSETFDTQTEYSFFITPSAIVGIIDTVKTLILDWALKLETEGIIGDGISFSSEEKEIAKNTENLVYKIYTSGGGVQIQHESPGALQVAGDVGLDIESIKNFISKLKKDMGSVDLPDDKSKELQSDIDTLEAQISSPAPKESIVGESLSSIRRILEGAGGGAAGQLLIGLAKWFAG